MPNDLITQYLNALRDRDRMALRRLETEAADYDKHNPFGPRLADELAALRNPTTLAA